MIFNVKNLGYIEEVSVDLSKDLIVLTGQNNTGKTYLAYAIYELLFIANSHNFDFKNFEYTSDKSQFDDRVTEEINIIDAFTDNNKRLIESILKQLKKNLPSLFATSEDRFINTDFKLHRNKKYSEKAIFHKSINESFEVPYKGLLIEVKKLLNNNTIEYNFDYSESSMGIDEDFQKELIRKNIYQNILHLIFNRPQAICAERQGINIFSGEIGINRNEIFSLLLEQKKSVINEIFDSLTQKINKYPRPIRDNLKLIEQLTIFKNNKTNFTVLAEELQNGNIGGQIRIDDTGNILFKPTADEDNELNLHLTSSTVKSLSTLIIYLRHLAQKGDCIIIDEPELNLHPDNQRKIARFIGRLINEGFQVVISTHSDYIVKELNNMIMLSKAKENNLELIEKLGFRGDELLKPEQVQALLFTLDSRKPVDIEVTEEGFNVTTIDETIAKQDALTEEIYYQLFEQKPV
jgi:predicted ATP-dependent endonuclease of OLD family